MATQSASTTSASANTVAQSASAISVRRPRSVTERWLFAAFLLSGAGTLITISALLSADPLTPSWWALLLAIAPVPLAVAVAFGPRQVSRLAVVAVIAAMIVGIVGSLVSWHSSGTSHVGVLFFPALAALLAGGFRLWRAGAR